MRVEVKDISKDGHAEGGTKGQPILYLWHQRWLLRCYNCGLLASLDHTVTIQDGKATVDPSIICPECQVHYHIKDGEVVL